MDIYLYRLCYLHIIQNNICKQNGIKKKIKADACINMVFYYQIIRMFRLLSEFENNRWYKTYICRTLSICQSFCLCFSTFNFLFLTFIEIPLYFICYSF